MKELLKNIPGLGKAYLHAAYLYSVAHQQWFRDWKKITDNSHLLKEWDFESGIEQERHELVLAHVARLRPDIGNANVLELGCSDGVFTARLAGRCASVTACDISPVARELAARRCGDFKNVVFREFDLVHEAIPGRYDVIFAMDVFEYVHGRSRLRTVIKGLVDALGPGGVLAFSSCRLLPVYRGAWWQRWLPEGADEVMKLIESEPALRLEHWQFHPADGSSIEGYLAHVIAIFSKR